jgi:DNA-binding transcriptional LysR family regulator
MNLKTLRYLDVIVEMGSFVKAAELLSLSQPALSQAIAQLEEELGLQLVLRGKRGTRVSLTEAGETVLRSGRAMLAEHERLIGELGAMKAANDASGPVAR